MDMDIDNIDDIDPILEDKDKLSENHFSLVEKVSIIGCDYNINYPNQLVVATESTIDIYNYVEKKLLKSYNKKHINFLFAPKLIKNQQGIALFVAATNEELYVWNKIDEITKIDKVSRMKIEENAFIIYPFKQHLSIFTLHKNGTIFFRNLESMTSKEYANLNCEIIYSSYFTIKHMSVMYVVGKVENKHNLHILKLDHRSEKFVTSFSQEITDNISEVQRYEFDYKNNVLYFLSKSGFLTSYQWLDTKRIHVENKPPMKIFKLDVTPLFSEIELKDKKNNLTAIMKADKNNLLFLSKKSENKKENTQTCLLTVWSVSQSIIIHKQQVDVPLSYGNPKHLRSLEGNFFLITFDKCVLVLRNEMLGCTLYHTLSCHSLTTSLLEKKNEFLFPESNSTNFEFNVDLLTKEIENLQKSEQTESNIVSFSEEQMKSVFEKENDLRKASTKEALQGAKEDEKYLSLLLKALNKHSNTTYVQRLVELIGEKKFWRRFLNISSECFLRLSSNLISFDTFGSIFENSDYEVLFHLITNLNHFSERVLVYFLRVFQQKSSDRDLSNFVTDSSKSDYHKKLNPFAPHRKLLASFCKQYKESPYFFMCFLLTKKYNSSQVVKEIRSWDLEEYKYLLVLLTRLMSLYTSPFFQPHTSKNYCFPTQSQVVEWINVLLDSNFKGIVFEEEISTEIVPCLHEIVEYKVEEMELLNSLKSLTHGLLSNPPNTPTNNDYSIQFLSI